MANSTMPPGSLYPSVIPSLIPDSASRESDAPGDEKAGRKNWVLAGIVLIQFGVFGALFAAGSGGTGSAAGMGCGGEPPVGLIFASADAGAGSTDLDEPLDDPDDDRVAPAGEIKPGDNPVSAEMGEPSELEAVGTFVVPVTMVSDVEVPDAPIVPTEDDAFEENDTFSDAPTADGDDDRFRHHVTRDWPRPDPEVWVDDAAAFPEDADFYRFLTDDQSAPLVCVWVDGDADLTVRVWSQERVNDELFLRRKGFARAVVNGGCLDSRRVRRSVNGAVVVRVVNHGPEPVQYSLQFVDRADTDGDAVPDAADNCPDTVNWTQHGADDGDLGDACNEALTPACELSDGEDCTEEMAITSEDGDRVLRFLASHRADEVHERITHALVLASTNEEQLYRYVRSLAADEGILRNILIVAPRIALRGDERLENEIFWKGYGKAANLKAAQNAADVHAPELFSQFGRELRERYPNLRSVGMVGYAQGATLTQTIPRSAFRGGPRRVVLASPNHYYYPNEYRFFPGTIADPARAVRIPEENAEWGDEMVINRQCANRYNRAPYGFDRTELSFWENRRTDILVAQNDALGEPRNCQQSLEGPNRLERAGYFMALLNDLYVDESGDPNHRHRLFITGETTRRRGVPARLAVLGTRRGRVALFRELRRDGRARIE